MAQIAFQLSFANSLGVWQPRALGLVRGQGFAYSVRLQSIRCDADSKGIAGGGESKGFAEELSPKELHHLRKKKELKVLRKKKKEMLEKKRLEELAKLPVVKPKYAMLRFENSKPLEGWNKPRKRRIEGKFRSDEGVTVPSSSDDNRNEDSSGLGAQGINSWSTEFEPVYQNRLKGSIGENERLNDTDATEVQGSGNLKRQEPTELVGDAERFEFSYDYPLDVQIKNNRELETLAYTRRYRENASTRTGEKFLQQIDRPEFLRDHHYSSSNAENLEQDAAEETQLRLLRNKSAKESTGTEGKLVKQNDGTRFLRKEVDAFSKVGHVAVEGREGAQLNFTGKKSARVLVGQKNGNPVYLSLEDEDSKHKRHVPRGDMNEEKQLGWLAKQLNNLATRSDGVHFSRLMRSGGVKITDGRAVVLLKLLGEQGNWRCAIQVVKWLTSRNRYPPSRSRYVHTTLLAVLGKSRRPTEALKAFTAMCEDVETYPDMAAYHCIAVTLGQCGYLEELLELVQILRRGPKITKYVLSLPNNASLVPDIVIFNAVLNACVPHKDWKCALWVLEEIRKEKLQPNSASFGLAIEVMVRAGKLNLAFETLERMEENRCYPNSLTYKVLVEGLGQAGKAGKAVELVQRMKQRGIVPSPSVYFALATTLCMSGRWKEAMLQVNTLVKLTDRPLVETFTGLITACERAGFSRDAIFVFRHMQNVCAPNIGTYNFMIALYGRQKMFVEARNLFDGVKLGRLSPKKMYKNDNRLVPDRFTYDAMLGACAMCGEWQTLESTYRQMVLQGYHIDLKRHTWILEALSKSGKHDLVRAMFDQITSKNGSKTSELYRIMISSCIMVGRDEEAFSYLEEMMKQATSINSKQLHQLQEVSCYLSDEDRPEFLDLLDHLPLSSDFNFKSTGECLDTKDKRVNTSSLQELRSSMLTYEERGRTSYHKEAPSPRKDHGTDEFPAIGVNSDRSDVMKELSTREFRNYIAPAKVKRGKGKDHKEKSIYRPDPDIPGWELLWIDSGDEDRNAVDLSVFEDPA